MAIELTALLGAVGAVSSLVKEAVPLVKAIRSGFMTKNQEAKDQLEKGLGALQKSLKDAGALAQVAESYFRTHENILELRSLCGRAQTFLEDNLNDCSNRTNAGYTGNWNVLNTMFQNIDANRDEPRKVVLDRAEWYDVEDKNQIELLLQQFNDAHTEATVQVRQKLAIELRSSLRRMTSALNDTESLLRSTIYDKILRGLQKIGQ